MTDATANGSVPPASHTAGSLLTVNPRTRRRNASETRFRAYGIIAIAIAMAALVVLLLSIITGGASSFRQTYVAIPVTVDAAIADPEGARNPDDMRRVTTIRYKAMLTQAMEQYLANEGIAIEGLTAAEAQGIMSDQAPAQLRNRVLADPELIGQTIPIEVFAAGRIDGYYKGRVTMETAQRDMRLMPEQLVLADQLKERGALRTGFNWSFITAPDASVQRPETAGLGVAILGSFYMMLVVLFLALPIGVAASIYLEEFAPKNRFSDLIEVNISNLAAVPSIVFGILGLAAFINFAGLPQSASIVGGLVLTLMTLPTVIITTRAALRAVPPSIREAALGVGASRTQTVFHHVLPLAMPGILTGTIIGLAQALGETAPLLLIGMMAFVQDYPSWPPGGLFEPASALPVQVYSWASRDDPAFMERASGATIVLLVFLLMMNLLAIFLRRKFERRW